MKSQKAHTAIHTIGFLKTSTQVTRLENLKDSHSIVKWNAEQPPLSEVMSRRLQRKDESCIFKDAYSNTKRVVEALSRLFIYQS